MSEYGYLIIKTDRSIEIVESDTYEFDLEELYQGSSCRTIQIISCQAVDRDLLMCIDDNGKIDKKPINEIATALYAPGYDFIVGDAVIGTRLCPDPYAEPDIYKMPLDMCKALKSILTVDRG